VFVAIVRHPGAVVHSLVRKFHYELADAADYWDSTNREILRRGLELGDDRFALLRYEDLVRHPEGTLRELMDWLGEPWSDDLLHHNDVQAARGAPRISAGNTHTREPLASDLADTWVEALDPAQLDVLAERTGSLAAFLGYDPAVPGTYADLVRAGGVEGRRRLLTGAGLARLQAQPGALTLDAAVEAVIMPEMSAAELAKRLQQVEAALTRLRSRRAVRWSNSLRRTQKRVATAPAELLGVAGNALRRRSRT
jgi:hypothetical protein